MKIKTITNYLCIDMVACRFCIRKRINTIPAVIRFYITLHKN